MKTNTRQLNGRLGAVYWGLPGLTLSQAQWVLWLKPRKEKVSLVLLLSARGQSLGVFTEALLRCFSGPAMFTSLFSKTQLAVDYLLRSWERKYSEKGSLFPPEPKSSPRTSLTDSLLPEPRWGAWERA